jgi:hypothetical protein
VLCRERRSQQKLRPSGGAAGASPEADRVVVHQGPTSAPQWRSHVFRRLQLAAALGPEGDPVHDVVAEQLQREQGLSGFEGR